VRAIGPRPGDEVLVTAYHHGSEVQALIDAGLTCRTTHLGQWRRMRRSSTRCLGRGCVRAISSITWGSPQNGARWRAWCDQRNLLLIEDAAESWLTTWQGTPIGSFGDVAISCIYKSFGLPDGGLLLSRPSPPTSR
jgi:DegT/DnrJ/EryC1/StrS aminotransferase family